MKKRGRLRREAGRGLNQGLRKAEIEIERGRDLVRREGPSLGPGPGPGLERGRRKVTRETDPGTGHGIDTAGTKTETDITETGEMTDDTEIRIMLTS